MRTSDCVCSSHARRDRTTLLRFLSSSMILASISLPTYGWRSRTRRISTSEAGQEAAQADVEDEPTLDDLDDGAGDDAVLLLDLLDRAPGALVLRTLLGQDQPAFLVLLLEDEGLDLVADGDDLVGVDVVLDGQLARGDDALGLVADVEQDLVPVDLDDATLDDVAVVEVLDRRVDRGEEVFLRADVVDGDLRGGRVDRAGSHVGGTPMVDSEMGIDAEWYERDACHRTVDTRVARTRVRLTYRARHAAGSKTSATPSDCRDPRRCREPDEVDAAGRVGGDAETRRAPTGPGGTARPTTTTPSTAPSSATPTSSGGRRAATEAEARPARATRRDDGCSRSAAGGGPVLALARRPGRRRGRRLRPVGGHAAQRARRIDADACAEPRQRASRSCSATAPPCRSPTRRSTRLHRVRRGARSSPTPARCMARGGPGAAARAAGSSSRRRTRVRWAFPDDPGPSGPDA